MNRIPTILIGAACAVFGLRIAAASQADEIFPVMHNEPIAVRVLNGKDGHPQTRTHVVLTAGYNRQDLKLALWREEAVTDSEGRVPLSNALKNLPLLQVEVLNRSGCAPGAESAVLSVERIRGSGLTSANRCGSTVAENEPGVFTVFVKGKKGGSPTGLTVVLPNPVSKTPSLVAGSVPVPPAVAVASLEKLPELFSNDDSTEPDASQPESPAPNAHEHETAKPAPHGRASRDTTEDSSQPSPVIEPAIGASNIGSSGPDATPAGLHAGTHAGPPAPTPADKPPLASTRTAAGHLDQAAIAVKAPPPNPPHTSRRTSAPLATRSHVSANRSVPRIRHISAASVRPTKTQANPSANTVPPEPSDRPLQQNRTSAAAPERISTPSAAQAHGSASAAVRAASGAASDPTAQTQATPPLLPDPKPASVPESPSTPVHFRVHQAAPVLAPVRAPEQTLGEDDLNFLCEPG
jgi:hypothetical protein